MYVTRGRGERLGNTALVMFATFVRWMSRTALTVSLFAAKRLHSTAQDRCAAAQPVIIGGEETRNRAHVLL
ncbi:MAG: hypothetical protein ACYC6N_22240 [Pirellulaceae bacterium]